MWIVRLALRNPYSIGVLALVILIAGILSIQSMLVDVFPVVDAARKKTPEILATAPNARIDSDDSRIRVVSDVRQARSDFWAALRQVQSARVGLQAAQAAYNTIEGRYQVGASSFIDVLAAQSALVTAQASQAQSVINLKYEENLLQYATGSL